MDPPPTSDEDALRLPALGPGARRAPLSSRATPSSLTPASKGGPRRWRAHPHPQLEGHGEHPAAARGLHRGGGPRLIVRGTHVTLFAVPFAGRPAVERIDEVEAVRRGGRLGCLPGGEARLEPSTRTKSSTSNRGTREFALGRRADAGVALIHSRAESVDETPLPRAARRALPPRAAVAAHVPRRPRSTVSVSSAESPPLPRPAAVTDRAEPAASAAGGGQGGGADRRLSSAGSWR